MGDCQLWVYGCVAVKEADPPVRITPRDAGVPELYQIVAECRERAGIPQKQRDCVACSRQIFERRYPEAAQHRFRIVHR